MVAPVEEIVVIILIPTMTMCAMKIVKGYVKSPMLLIVEIVERFVIVIYKGDD